MKTVRVKRMENTRLSRGMIERILQIHYMACKKNCPSAAELAKMFEVSRRTIERDIEFLRDRLMAPLQYDHQCRKYYYIEPFNLPSLTLTEGEFIVFFLGEQLLRQCIGSTFENHVRSAFEKIKILFQTETMVDPNGIEEYISFKIPPLRGDEKRVAEYYSLLFNAIEDKKVICIEYYAPSKDEVTVRHVEPYHLTVIDGACYMIGFCRLRNDFRIFAVDRIRDLEITCESFTPDPDFDIEEYFKSSWRLEKGERYEVVLKFDPEQAKWIRERRWHPEQKIAEQPDGSLILSVTVEGLREIKRWLMQFGPHVEVISPPELRESVLTDAKKMVELYS